MAHSSPFGLFILVLCLMASVCTHADEGEDEAKEAVKKAKKSVDDVLEKAKREVNNAEELLNVFNTQKKNVEKDAKESVEIAKGNSEAAKIAQTAQSVLDGITALYLKELEQANNYINSMNNLKTIASTLFVNSRNLHTSAQASTNYTKIKEDAVELKTQAKVLENNITTAKSSFVDMYTIKWKMKKFVSDARIVKYQVDAIVTTSKFDTLLNSSERNVTLTEEKRNEISDIEKEMQKLYNESTSDTRSHISRLHSSVRGSLLTVSNAVQNAKTALESIINLNQTVYDALESAKSATDERNAKTGVDNVNWFVQNAEKDVEEITQAVQSATIHENYALSWKNEATNLINNQNKKPDVEQDREETNSQDHTKPHKPLQITKENPKESETIKPTTINNMENSVSEGTDTTQNTINGPKENEMMKPQITTQDPTGSKESVKATIVSPTWSEVKEPTITNSNKAVSEGKEHTEDTKESPTESETIKPTTRNSDESMNEQDMENTTESPVVRGTRQPTITNPNKPVSGGTVPTRHNQSDSAMTVPVPLILALIAFAVLN